MLLISDIIIRCSGPFYASQDSSIWCAVVQFYRTLKRFNADEWNSLLWDTEILVTACRKVKSNLLCVFSLSWEKKQPLNLSKWDTLDKEVPWGQVRGHLKKRFSHLWLSGCRHWCAFAQTSFARHKTQTYDEQIPKKCIELNFFKENIQCLTQINQLMPRQRFENNPSRVCAIFTVSYI